MNINELREAISSLSETAVIGKSTELGSVVCHVLGVVRRESRLQLLILQYDEEFRQRLEEAEIAELCGAGEKPETNRACLLGDNRIQFNDRFRSAEKVKIGDREFAVSGAENRRCSGMEWECAAIFTEFLRHGWLPVGIEYPDMDRLFLTVLELEGDYPAIPDFGESRALRFIMRPTADFHPVEQPVVLSVGGEAPIKLFFRDRGTGSEHWVMISRVYMCDMWADMEKTFDDPGLLERLGEDEIARCKADFEKNFSEICPKGMCFPVIEYESGEDLSLQFHTTAWLDSEPTPRNSGMAFLLKPDAPVGVLGLKLKAAVLQEPMLPDTASVEAELFQVSLNSTAGDIVIF